MSEFQGKVAVVTGAGSGIGRALVQALAARGCRLAISDINEAALAETAAALPAETECHLRRLDVGNRAAIKSYAADVLSHYEVVDIVINNAGVAVAGDALEVSDDNFDWLMNINFWGVINCSRAFLPALEQRPEAWLVNISSVFGLIGIPGQTAYNASKFAVRGFTEALWHEYEGTGLCISCVHPGGIKTNIAASSRVPDSISEEEKKEQVDRFARIAKTTPERAAEVITSGMLKKKRRILIGRDAWLIHQVARLFPQQYMRLFNVFFRAEPSLQRR